MVYDSLVWGESTQNNGYAGVNGKGPTPIAYTGDTNILRKGFGTPIITSLGSTSVTKPQGCRISGNRSYGTNYIMGPGGLMFGHSVGTVAVDLVFPFQEGETITGQASNTNVSEAIIIHADCAYGTAHPHPKSAGEGLARAPGQMWCVPISATAAAAVTPAVIGTLDTLTTDTGDQWLDTRADYHILGFIGTLGVASGQSTLIFTGLGGEWAGYVPGIPTSGIQATFETMGNSYCYDPIPFTGDALPSYMANALTNTAELGGLLLSRH